jgi:hypothetical protein
MLHMNVDVFRGRPLVQLLCLVAALLTAMRSIAINETITQKPGALVRL